MKRLIVVIDFLTAATASMETTPLTSFYLQIDDITIASGIYYIIKKSA
jgi:hypothetical protein